MLTSVLRKSLLTSALPKSRLNLNLKKINGQLVASDGQYCVLAQCTLDEGTIQTDSYEF